MRRIVVSTTLLALALPFAASAGLRTPGDGTLLVRDLDGYVTISARGGGALIGRCDQCRLFLQERAGADEIVPVVSGGRGVDIGDGDDSKERYVGKDLRWKVIGGFVMIVRAGTDVDLSVVGRGNGGIFGTQGTYVLNGQTTQVAPGPEPVQFRLSPIPATP
jgi:hypothetical protein